MDIQLRIWRQENSNQHGGLESYSLKDLSPDMSFLEMLDTLNQQLISKGLMPVAFDHDCREGICGMCGAMVNGVAHGPLASTTLCQLHMRHFADGAKITIEPWRARAFPVLRDLIVDRSALDRIIQAGGFISVGTGSAPDANTMLISKEIADRAMDAASCIGCGACVAACPNSAAMLFTGAKVGHLALLPQGHAERKKRARQMVAVMEQERFGSCSVHRECAAVCPKDISLDFIAMLNRELLRSL